MEMIKQARRLKSQGSPEDIADAVQLIKSTDILVDGDVIHNIKK